MYKLAQAYDTKFVTEPSLLEQGEEAVAEAVKKYEKTVLDLLTHNCCLVSTWDHAENKFETGDLRKVSFDLPDKIDAIMHSCQIHELTSKVLRNPYNGKWELYISTSAFLQGNMNGRLAKISLEELNKEEPQVHQPGSELGFEDWLKLPIDAAYKTDDAQQIAASWSYRLMDAGIRSRIAYRPRANEAVVRIPAKQKKVLDEIMKEYGFKEVVAFIDHLSSLPYSQYSIENLQRDVKEKVVAWFISGGFIE